MEKEDYNKTWYWKYTFPWQKNWSASPDNWISGTPIKLFGRMVAIKWKLAKANYPWSKI